MLSGQTKIGRAGTALKRILLFGIPLAITAGLGLASAQAPNPAAALPVGAGRDDVVRACSQCHQLSAVTDRRDSRAGWSATVDTMVARGAPLTSAQAEVVVAYLAQHFGASPAPAAATPSGPAPQAPPRNELFDVNLPVRRSPADSVRPVTDAMLANPPASSWLTWRGTHDDHGFSPLRQINKANVGQLKLAWSWSLPPGPNEGTPLVHDGVMVAHGYGDFVQAFDAATGDLLWQYGRAPAGRPNYKKNLALYGDKVFVGTSDAHVVALDIKTGKLVWDAQIGGEGISVSGGPMVVRGKVIQGTAGRTGGGNLIVALDAETGKKAWEFHTIARPGEPGGDSWNGQTMQERQGGSVWTAGSYDAELNLVYFGAAPTYNTGPLRAPVKPGMTNDALYSDATLALNPDTGKLVWYYQHMKNDQWDMDWAFERMVATLPVNGKPRKVVITAGKPAIYDVLDAATGQYIFSKDVGLQNLVKSIDPKTGEKTIDPARDPANTPFLLCPYFNSGKEWLPGAYSDKNKLIFAPLNEACVDIFALPPGQRGLLTGLGYKMRPVPNHDGKYSHLTAINFQTRQIQWVMRQREPVTTGVLNTGGGLVFAGFADRKFKAFDELTGKELWSARLNDVPSSAPISYAVGGKQYVAMVVGCCGVQARDVLQFVPEVQSPPDRGAAIWVFELPGPAPRR